MVPYWGFGIGLCCWPTGPTINVGQSQMGLSKWKSVLLDTGITYIPLTVVTLWACWAMTGVAGERGWAGHPILLISKIALSCSHSLMSIHMRHKWLHFLLFLLLLLLVPIQRGLLTYLIFTFPQSQFSNHVLFHFPNHPPKPWTIAGALVSNLTSGHFSF